MLIEPTTEIFVTLIYPKDTWETVELIDVVFMTTLQELQDVLQGAGSRGDPLLYVADSIDDAVAAADRHLGPADQDQVDDLRDRYEVW